jgi:hypothetical protein
MVMTGIIWWTATHDCGNSRDQESQTEDPKPIVLGITMRPANEERAEIGHSDRLTGWLFRSIRKVRFSDMVERWTDSAVAVLQAELGMDAEEGLLLPVQESERMEGKNHRIDIEVDPGRNGNNIKES